MFVNPIPDAETLVLQTKAVYERAHREHMTYGDSKSRVPCDDGVISCDRMVARAIWELGCRDQQPGGMTTLVEEAYLSMHGWVRVTDPNALRRGDIVLMDDGQDTPRPSWHTFLLTDFQNVNDISKYDCGMQKRIDGPQPFEHVKLCEWSNKRFRCAFRLASEMR